MSGAAGRREAAAAGALAVAAVAVWALARTYPNYDTYWHLVWGREVLDGGSPSFEAYAAPTQHPLWVTVCGVLAAVFGEGAQRAVVLVTALAMVALVWGAFRLAAAAFGPWPAVAGAAFAGSSFALLLYAAKGYLDVPFLALVVWAAVAVVGGRVTLALGLLALAGLLRPEAWVLAGLLWLWRGERSVGRLALVAAAPALWMLTDLVVTGNPIFSFSSTNELAEDLGRERGLAAVPRTLVTYLAAVTKPPVAALGVAGVAAAWVLLRRGPRRDPVLVVGGMLAAGVATYVAIGIGGLSALPRYLTVPAVALCLFAGWGLLGWTALDAAHRWRRPWRAGSLAAAVLGVAALAVLLPPRLDRLVTELRFVRDSHDDLVALLDAPAVVRARECGPLTFPTYRLVPDARWVLDAPRGAVRSRAVSKPSHGVAVFTTTRKALLRWGLADGVSPRTNVPDPGYAPVARSGMFVAYARC